MILTVHAVLALVLLVLGQVILKHDHYMCLHQGHGMDAQLQVPHQLVDIHPMVYQVDPGNIGQILDPHLAVLGLGLNPVKMEVWH